jgi:hypothetical protein
MQFIPIEGSDWLDNAEYSLSKVGDWPDDAEYSYRGVAIGRTMYIHIVGL